MHPNYYRPNKETLKILSLEKNERYIILRFVSWTASHDRGVSGISIDIKRQLIKQLSKYIKVLVSSEESLPKDLIKYQIKIPPEKIHDIMSHATFFLGESGTMAAESGIMGVPSIQISGLPDGTIGSLSELSNKYGLIKIYEKYNTNIVDEIIEKINDDSSYKEINDKKQFMINDKIDVNTYMIQLIKQELSND